MTVRDPDRDRSRSVAVTLHRMDQPRKARERRERSRLKLGRSSAFGGIGGELLITLDLAYRECRE